MSPRSETTWSARITGCSFNESAHIAVYASANVAIVWGSSNSGVLGIPTDAFLAAVDTTTGETLWSLVSGGLTWNLVHPLADRPAVFIAAEPRGLMGPMLIRDARTGAVTATAATWALTANFDCGMTVADEQPGEFLVSSCVFVAVVSASSGEVRASYDLEQNTVMYGNPIAAFTPRNTFTLCADFDNGLVVAVDRTSTTVGFFSLNSCPLSLLVSHSHDVVYGTVLVPETPIDVPPFDVYAVRMNFSDFVAPIAAIKIPWSVQTVNTYPTAYLDDEQQVLTVFDDVDGFGAGIDLLTGHSLWSNLGMAASTRGLTRLPQASTMGLVWTKQNRVFWGMVPILTAYATDNNALRYMLAAPAFMNFGATLTRGEDGTSQLITFGTNCAGLYTNALVTAPVPPPAHFRNATDKPLFPATNANTLPPSPTVQPFTLPPFPTPSPPDDNVAGKWWIWGICGCVVAVGSGIARFAMRRTCRRGMRNRRGGTAAEAQPVTGRPVNARTADTTDSVQQVLV
uniref:Uncharacterized protein n=1 Tax=Neobodo designis TaxID=312471 RepID=A0A7S1MIW4_NEODS|mmetsp:Transcript_41406/g.127968  ORF Transcript_41406/g.127968 Transcript_41406/m.127968 type:complete len:513 (+) Transcript_41406:1782-3320(+)